MRRLVALPPVWVLLALVAGWPIGALAPVAGAPAPWRAGGLGLAALGLGLMVGAAWTMMRARTTVMPGRVPDALVTEGIFRLSRNPIYLGDLLLVAGLLLAGGRPLGLVVLPPLAAWLRHRFIRPEEAVLRRQFGAAYDAYAARVRRWI